MTATVGVNLLAPALLAVGVTVFAFGQTKGRLAHIFAVNAAVQAICCKL